MKKKLSQLIIIATLFFSWQVKLFAQLNGATSVCVGETEAYEIVGANSGTIYSWSITPSGSGILANVQNYNLAFIQWNATGTYVITVSNGSTNQTLTVTVNQTLKPYFTYDNEVGCQKLYLENGVQSSQMEESDYINVCENSEVIYTVHGTLVGTPPSLNFSNFDWTVSGGSIIEVDSTPVTPSTIANGGGVFSGSISTVKVQWGNTGAGYLEVTELTPYASPNYQNPTNCTVRTGSLSFKIIESPTADFLLDDIATLPQPCYNVCLNHEVNFIDQSTANSGSDIISWEWDFGDGPTISHLQNPGHKYTTDGTYTVQLKVTNKCGCSDIFEYNICVDKLPGLHIECPSVVCEGEKVKYVMHDPPCSPYVWSVTGGTIVQQNDPEVIVHWNNVGPDGYGYLGLNGSNCTGACSNITKIKVPVVLTNGTIDGPTTICANTEYYFELPAWPATNFHWSFTTNNSNAYFGSYDENSHKVSVITGNAGTFTLNCVYENTISKNYQCGGSTSITVDVLEKAIITANDLICVNTSVQASVSNYTVLTGNTQWVVEDIQGNQVWSGSSSTQNITIPATTFNTPGDYFLFATNPASFCDPDFVKVTVRDVPPAPTSIVGEDYVCPYYPYPYSVDLEENTITHWTASNGNIQGVAYGSSINATWLPANPKSITTFREWEDIPNCVSANFSKTINNIVVTGIITGNTTTVEDGTESYTLNLTGGVVPENIVWTVTPSEYAGVTSGQGTNTVDINFLNHPYNPQLNVTILCNVTKCGVTTVIPLPVSVLSGTQITSISGPTTICSGDNSTWSVNTTGAAPSAIEWNFGDGTVITPSAAGQPFSSVSHSYSNFTNNNLVFTITASAYTGSNPSPASVYTQNVTVQPQPNVGLSPANVETYCPTIGTYPVTVSNTSIGSFTYQWYFFATNASGPLAIIGATGTSYTINSTIPNTNPISTTSDGDYWCVVTNIGTGCSTASNHKTVLKSCSNPPPGGCTPMAPYGITNYSVTNNCGDIQASCTTTGAIGVNINSYSWQLTGPGSYITSGTATQNQSMVFTVDKAGIYNLEINVQYKDVSDPTQNCPISEDDYITVPLIADFLKAITCNTNGSSYDLQFTDNSSVYPANTALTYQWKVNNVVVSTTSNFMLSALTPGSVQNVEFTVSDGTNTCIKSVQITIPSLPIADFSANTTYPNNPSSPYKSCEGREIVLTNLSTPASGIKFYDWNFNDNSHSTQIDPVKVYAYSGYVQSNNGIAEIILKVTNNYGCYDEITKNVQVFPNSYQAGNPQYNSTVSDFCFGHPLSTAIVINSPSGGSSPFTYQWYKETTSLPGQVGSTLSGTPTLPGTGAYWVMVTDAHNCIKAINPTPAMISAKYPPSAIINGKSDICDGEEFTLTALTGMPSTVGLTYQWTETNSGNSIVLGQSSKKVSIARPAGTYIYNLKVIGFSNCPDVISSPFVLTVHPNPAPPSVSMNLINCDEYKIELTGTSSISPALAFNWSNGSSGQSTYVYNGGAYRLWITDQHGCESSTDIEVPQSPDIYFWRFPTGCYTFCPQDMPKRVDGPWSVAFDSWEWRKDNAVVSNNGGYSGSGHNSPTDPLIIDQTPTGEGNGDYNWSLDNGLCKKQSDFMSVFIKEYCCDNIRMDLHTIQCHQTLPNDWITYYYEIEVSNVICPNAIYSLSGALVSNITSAPATLNMGTTTLSGYFDAPNAASITLNIMVYCPDDDCSGELTIQLPGCSKRLAKPNNDSLSVIENNSILRLIPNPANNLVIINYKSSLPKEQCPKLQIAILDAFGKEVSTIKVNDCKGKTDVSLINYPQGLYFVELLENDQRINIEKLIVIH